MSTHSTPDNKAAGHLRIGVLGHYGNDNLGDEAIVQAVIENLRGRIPDAEVVCFSVNPANTAWRHGVPAFALSRRAQTIADKWTRAKSRVPSESGSPPAAASTAGLKAWIKGIPGLRASVRALRFLASLPGVLIAEGRFIMLSRARLREMDLLLIAGSNQFLDNFGGVWGFPYAMLKWAWLGRVCGCKVAFVSIGAGPLTSPVSMLFVRLAMLAAHDVSFRDEASRELATCSWAGQDAKVSPDLAFSLPLDPPAEDAEAGRPRIGVNPMPVHDRRYWHEANDQAYSAYVERLTSFCAHLESAGYPWYFYATQPKDANVMADVATRLRAQGWSAQDLDEKMFIPQTVDELVSRIAQTEILVATRFHGVVLSLMAGRPALGVCYHRKTADVLDKIGLAGFHMHIDSLDAQALAAMLDKMEGQRIMLQKTVREQAQRYRIALDEQYDRLLALLPDARCRGGIQAVAASVADLSAR